MSEDNPKSSGILTLKSIKTNAQKTPKKSASGSSTNVRSGSRARRVEQNSYQLGEGKIKGKVKGERNKGKSKKYLKGDYPPARKSAQANDSLQHSPTNRVQESNSRNDKPARGTSERKLRFNDASSASKHKSFSKKHLIKHDYESQLQKAFATCPQGLEQVLADELNRLNFKNVSTSRSGCHFETDWSGAMRANLYSRIATRILMQVAFAKVYSDQDALYEFAKGVAWEQWFGAEHTLRVDTSAIKSPMQSLHFCNLRVKDAICDRLRDRESARPSIDTVRPDARVHLFLQEDFATLYLDTSGESLFKRGWRLDKGAAPLRENLAAGILALAGWQPGHTLLDPFCGSGTILIEAALIAQNVPPGINRPFQFERLRNFNSRHWYHLKQEAHALILPNLETCFYGSDIDSRALEAAAQNMERANLSNGSIHFEIKNVHDTTAPTEQGFLITNPPYGERLNNSYNDLWHPWSGCLKHNFANWQISIISSDMELPKKLRLKPKRRTPLFNGDLDCRLFSFDMVSDSYRHE